MKRITDKELTAITNDVNKAARIAPAAVAAMGMSPRGSLVASPRMKAAAAPTAHVVDAMSWAMLRSSGSSG